MMLAHFKKKQTSKELSKLVEDLSEEFEGGNEWKMPMPRIIVTPLRVEFESLFSHVRCDRFLPAFFFIIYVLTIVGNLSRLVYSREESSG